MKKTLAREKGQKEAKLFCSEYRFDYSKSKPNRFAAVMSGGAIVIVLEPELAGVKSSKKGRASRR
jgi:hypothetical protein